MTDQSKLAALSDGPTADVIRSAGAVRSFKSGGAVTPTEAQKEAGNYRKGHVRVHGMDVSIETPKGAKRSGKGKDGKPWSVTMPADYGYIRGTKGADGDHVDAYIGPHPGHPTVHVVDQLDADTGKFDEHKALIGFRSKQHALDHYHRGFSDGCGKDRVGAVTSMPAHKFRSWVEKGRRSQPLGTLRIDRTHDDPYLAGESENHRCLYIDKRVPKQMVVKGKSFDPAKYLGVHESDERKHMDAGMKYEPAHRLALKAERAAVEADGIDWNGYQEQMHKLASITQKEKNPHPPSDLYKGPFPNAGQRKLTREGDSAPDVKKYAEGGEVTGDDEQGPWSDYQDQSGPWDYYQTTDYSVAGEALKRGAQAVLPGLGSIPGMVAGAGVGEKLGTVVGGGLGALVGPEGIPVGAMAGKVIGGLGGAAVGGIASNVSLRGIQDWFMDKLGLTPDEAKAEAFQQEHPTLAAGADIAGSLVGMSPGGAATTLGQRAAMGAGQAAIEAGSEYLHTGELDPSDIAMAAAAGAAFPGLNKLGEPLGQLGTRLTSKVGVRAGRPDMNPGPMKQLPAPPDFTTSAEGETAAYPGGDDQVFSQAAAPRPGTGRENERPIYEMPRSEWTSTRPGTRDVDNIAPGAENEIQSTKNEEDITADKYAATPAHAGYDPNSTLSTSHEMARPKQDQNIGNPQSFPVGSERDYRTTTDSNVHTTASGAGNPPTAEMLDPTTGGISQELTQALTQDNGPGRNTPPRGLKAADTRMQKSMRVPFEGEAANENVEGEQNPYRLIETNDEEGRGVKSFDIRDPNGNTNGSVVVRLSLDGKNLHILNIYGTSGPNSVGLSNTRGLLRQLKNEFPTVETISGNRITGAREDKGLDKGFTRLNITPDNLEARPIPRPPPLPELEARRGGEPTKEELEGVPPTPENVRSLPAPRKNFLDAARGAARNAPKEPEIIPPSSPKVQQAIDRIDAWAPAYRDPNALAENRRILERGGPLAEKMADHVLTKLLRGPPQELHQPSDTGIVEGAVTDTAAKLRERDLPKIAEAVEKNPSIEPQARRILQDLTAPPTEGGTVDAELMRRGMRAMEAATTPEERDRAMKLMEQARNPNAQTEAPVRDQVVKQGDQRASLGEGEETVATATVKEARQKQFAAQAAQTAFEKHPPTDNKIPTTQVDKDLFVRRLSNALDTAKAENLGKDPLVGVGRKRSAAQEWLKAAKSIVNTKRVTPKMISDFMSMEADARQGKAKGQELRQISKAENETAFNKRVTTGEEADTGEAISENPTASRGGVINQAEEDMIDRLYEKARIAHNMKNLDYEHWMDENTATVTPPDSENFAAPTKNAANAHDEVGYHNQWEQDAAAAAYKASWQRFGRENLKNKDQSKIPEPSALKNLWNDEKGTLDIEKIKGSILARAKPINDWIVRNIMPEMFSQRAQYAEPYFAKRQVQQSRLIDQYRDALDGEWHMFNKMSPYDQVSFMTRYEQGKPQPNPYLDSVAERFKGMLDNAYQNELLWGSKADYVENYMSHIFENENDYNIYKASMVKRFGPTWFQKQRDFQTINDALQAGYKLKFTNPAEVVTRRLMASSDMMLKMQLLHELNSMGLAYPIGEKAPNVDGQWQTIGAPNRDNWSIAPDVQALWKNGVDAKGLWADQGSVGSIFRGWMNLKNIWTPIKMSLSAFHPLHIAAGVLQADNFARGWSEGQGSFFDKLRSGVGEMAKNIGDPLFAFGGSNGTFHPEFIGKQVREALKTPWESKTPWQEEATRWADEGGFRGTMSHEETINAQHDFHKAWQGNDWTKWIPAGGRIAIEKAMGPIFNDWIPNLKMASYYRSAASYMQQHPEAVNDPDMRRLALRTIAKQVDNRYGEMFYGGLFWNRYAKDASIGSFLSFGWNLGFAREFGGAGISAVRGMAGPRNMAGRVVQDASSKAAYVSAYTGITMAMAGAMGFALSGQLPSTPMDYIFPRAGGQNPDGSPRRLSTMFYTREPIQALAHIQERGSVAGGLGQMLWNKMIFEPVVEAYNNRDFFGYQLYDPQANWLQQWGQLAKIVLGDAFDPISMSSMERAQQTGGGLRDKALAVAGFGPAPGYVSKDALQNRISHLYYQGPGAGEKPYENKERDQERRNTLADLNNARKQGDTQATSTAQQKLVKLGVSPGAIARETRGALDTYQFSRLDPQVQKELVSQMDDKQFFKYAMGSSPVQGRQRIALIQEYQRLHLGKPLPQR